MNRPARRKKPQYEWRVLDGWLSAVIFILFTENSSRLTFGFSLWVINRNHVRRNLRRAGVIYETPPGCFGKNKRAAVSSRRLKRCCHPGFSDWDLPPAVAEKPGSRWSQRLSRVYPVSLGPAFIDPSISSRGRVDITSHFNPLEAKRRDNQSLIARPRHTKKRSSSPRYVQLEVEDFLSFFLAQSCGSPCSSVGHYGTISNSTARVAEMENEKKK